MPLRTLHDVGRKSSDEEEGRRPEESSGAQVSPALAGKVLRIPKAILDAGKECAGEDTATFPGIMYNKGPYALGVSSAMKFCWNARRPAALLSELANKILRPPERAARTHRPAPGSPQGPGNIGRL